ncbi:MAG: PQQ-like beta-propeller repeat protein [Acidobacteria bacterium]|nr:PQQ-like beta-propeller repeat protein [Acidobacteriota bacterium]
MSRHLAIAVLAAVSLPAGDWPQHLGPSRNGVSPEPVSWVAGGPAVVWKREVGQGFASPAVAQGKLILFHRAGDKEVVECLDAATGKKLWSLEYPTAYRDDFGFDEGPRATPTIAAGRVFTFGAEGMLHAIDLATGKKLWSIQTHQKFGVRKGFFGAAGAPLVEGDRVILNLGGSGAGIVAFDAQTGKTLWQATNDESGYSSGVAAILGGVRHALFFTRTGLTGLDPANGTVRFRFPWRARMSASVNAASPLVAGDLVFVSASYGTGAALLRVGDGSPKQLWSSDEVMSNHYATCVYQDGFLYGYHGRQEEGPSLRCVDLKTGKVRWNVDRFLAGTVTLAGGQLLLMREDGELVLAPASPEAFKPSARARVLPATVRAYPALAGGKLYVRNEKTLVCLDVHARPAPAAGRQ